MHQAVESPSTAGAKASGGKFETVSASTNVLAFPTIARLRADVPPFDATNPAHLRAWEAVWDFSGHRFQSSAAVCSS